MQATFPAFRLNRNALFYMGSCQDEASSLS